MKKHIKKHIVLLLSACLILGIPVPIPVFGAADPVVTMTFTPETLTQSNTAQQVAVTICAEPAINVGASYSLAYDPALSYTEFKSDTVVSDRIEHHANAATIDALVTTQDRSTSNLGTFYFDVPSCKVGDTYTFTLKEVAITSGNSVTNVDEISQTLTVTAGRTAALSGPDTAFTGGADDTVAYTIQVTGNTYQSAELKLTYDSTLLAFDEENNSEAVTDRNGVVTIVQYGENQTPAYTVKFKAIATGTATTTLTSAAFGTSATAVSGDLTPAVITASTVNTVINKASFTVQLPAGVSGSTSVNYGQSYTFTPTFAEPAKYDYQVTATMGGIPVTVTDNQNGTFTVANVTGDLEITVTPTAKKYTVSFATKTVKTALPAGGDVTYGVDYTFAMPTEEGCTLAVTSATIGGQSYTCPAPVDGKVTIPGEAIVGNIVLSIERVSAAVTVEGTGASDADGPETALIGQDYTLTLRKDASYHYTVTATMERNAVALVDGENTYTVKNVTGPIVFQITKTINTNTVAVSEYIKLDETSVWLVKNAVTKLAGSVYTYNDTKMLWSDAYNAYCCLVVSATKPAVSADNLKLVTGTAEELAYSLDVNRSGKVDANDAQLIHDLYNGKYTSFSVVAMEKFLLADTNRQGTVDTSDAVVVVNHITGQ